MVYPVCQQKISCGQQEEGLGVVHHLQREHHQYYLMHHYLNAKIFNAKLKSLNSIISALTARANFENFSAHQKKNCMIFFIKTLPTFNPRVILRGTRETQNKGGE